MSHRNEGIAQTKEFILYFFGADEFCRVSCDSRQKWKFKKREDLVELERDNVMLRLSHLEFERNWRIVDVAKN